MYSEYECYIISFTYNIGTFCDKSKHENNIISK